MALYLLTRPLWDRIVDGLASFIPSVEGFRSTPYWDVTRYSWGYGTQAPGPTGSITREQAFSDMLQHLRDDYEYLAPLITTRLSANQWVALLSFSYNEGIGAALKLVPDINSGSAGLHDHWMQYVYAGGAVNSNLVERRAKEFSLYSR